MPENSEGEYDIGRIRDGDVAGIGPSGGRTADGDVEHRRVGRGADDTAAAVRAAGGSMVMELFDVDGLGVDGGVSDPEGAVFRVWEA